MSTTVQSPKSIRGSTRSLKGKRSNLFSSCEMHNETTAIVTSSDSKTSIFTLNTRTAQTASLRYGGDHQLDDPKGICKIYSDEKGSYYAMVGSHAFSKTVIGVSLFADLEPQYDQRRSWFAVVYVPKSAATVSVCSLRGSKQHYEEIVKVLNAALEGVDVTKSPKKSTSSMDGDTSVFRIEGVAQCSDYLYVGLRTPKLALKEGDRRLGTEATLMLRYKLPADKWKRTDCTTWELDSNVCGLPLPHGHLFHDICSAASPSQLMVLSTGPRTSDLLYVHVAEVGSAFGEFSHSTGTFQLLPSESLTLFTSIEPLHMHQDEEFYVDTLRVQRFKEFRITQGSGEQEEPCIEEITEPTIVRKLRTGEPGTCSPLSPGGFCFDRGEFIFTYSSSSAGIYSVVDSP